MAEDYQRRNTERNIDSSLFAALGLKIGELHSLNFTATRLRQTTDQAQIDEGLTSSGNIDRITELEWVENSLQTLQLDGEHSLPQLGDLYIKWQVTDSRAGRYSPNTREYRFTYDEQLQDFTFESFNQQRIDDFDDNATDYGIDLRMPFNLRDGIDLNVQAGAALLDRDRESSIRRFRFGGRRPPGPIFDFADYVLRDVIGRVSVLRDLAYPQPDAGISKRLDALLKEKVATVTGLTDLVLFNGDCIFAAAANYPTQGTRSRQRFCNAARVDPGQSLHIQYMPPDKSASGRPVVLTSRTVGSPDGVLLGGAMVVIDLEYAQKWIAAFEIDDGDVLGIVDADGMLLARNPPLPEAIGRHTSPPSSQPSFGELDNTATFTAVSPMDGRERIFGLSKLERFPFVVIVGFDKLGVLAGWQHRAWQFTVGYMCSSSPRT